MNIRNKVRRMGAAILAVLMVIITTVGNMGILEVKADSVQIVQNGYAHFGGRSCGKFLVNGEVAFCMEHIKNSPETGTIGESNPFDNDLIKTILYYGWGGPGNIYADEEEGIVRTSFALSYVYTGDPAETGDPNRTSGIVLAQPLLDYAQAHLITDLNISFDKASVKGEILPDGYQQTEGIHIQGDARNTLTFNVPTSVKMHNPTTGFVGNGQVTVKGGDSIFFTSDEENPEDFNTGELAGSMGFLQVLLIKTSDPSTQDLSKLGHMDPLKKTSLAVTWADKPEIQTQASDKATGTHQGHVMQAVTIKDAVSYTNLIPGKKYTVKGTLRNRKNGDPIQVNGQDVTVERTFTPVEVNGTVDLEFDVPGSVLRGKTVVAFEKLIQDGVEVAVHEDLTDENQTVEYPEVKIGTLAHDVETEINQAFPNESTVICDEISYKNLIPGKEYVVKGVLVDKATGEAIQEDGQDVTVEKTFTVEKADGSVTVEFALNSSSFAGKDLVVFEKLYFAGQEIASHEDLEDVGQTVTFKDITIHTLAQETESELNEAFVKKDMVIKDEVSYTGLIPGREYTMRGILMEKSTGEVFLQDGKEITSEIIFTPEEPGGSITMEFELDGSDLAGKDLVVFENLFYGEREIASHADLTDEGQTIRVKDVQLKTTATDKITGSHQITAKNPVTIIDKVEYTGLIVGKEYVVKGTLMDKSTGKAFLVNGKAITVEKKFMAEQSDGNVELEFSFDGSALAGKELVVFEKLFYNEREIAVHEDLTDEGQTVKIMAQKITPPPVKTGDTTPVTVMVGVLAGSAFLVCCLAMCAIKKRKNND